MQLWWSQHRSTMLDVSSYAYVPDGFTWIQNGNILNCIPFAYLEILRVKLSYLKLLPPTSCRKNTRFWRVNGKVRPPIGLHRAQEADWVERRGMLTSAMDCNTTDNSDKYHFTCLSRLLWSLSSDPLLSCCPMTSDTRGAGVGSGPTSGSRCCNVLQVVI